MYVLEVWRELTTPDIWIERLCDLIKTYKPMAWAAPRDQIKRSIEPYMRKRMDERQAWCQIVEISEAGSKPEKARSFQARMAMGKVYLPKSAPWLDDLRLELLAFPLGHDDSVDALSVIGRMLEDMVAGAFPEPKDEPRVNDYVTYGDVDAGVENSWRTA